MLSGRNRNRARSSVCAPPLVCRDTEKLNHRNTRRIVLDYPGPFILSYPRNSTVFYGHGCFFCTGGRLPPPSGPTISIVCTLTRVRKKYENERGEQGGNVWTRSCFLFFFRFEPTTGRVSQDRIWIDDCRVTRSSDRGWSWITDTVIYSFASSVSTPPTRITHARVRFPLEILEKVITTAATLFRRRDNRCEKLKCLSVFQREREKSVKYNNSQEGRA